MAGALLLTACGEDSSRAEVNAWAEEACAEAERFGAEVVEPMARGVELLAQSLSGDDAIRQYSALIRQAERDTVEMARRFDEIEAPDPVAAFHDAQVATGFEFARAADAFADEMDAYLETGDLAQLDEAYPNFVAASDARIERIERARDLLPVEAAAALDSQQACGSLGASAPR